MRILEVDKNSPAALVGLRPGDEILAINGHAINDALDFLFHSADDELVLRVRRADGSLQSMELVRRDGAALGLRLPEDPTTRCSNRCIFCFIDQNPKGLRPSLYVKDEDYRLSLLHGNYITLTGLDERELTRIAEQRLSPLYISVHATVPAVRRRLLRARGRHSILPQLERLAGAGITMHTQIVLVPDYNDGPVLERTLDDLEALRPAVASVAIVPVGLTEHRRGLTPLRALRPLEAREVVDRVSARQERCRRRGWGRLHFLADEIYLLAGRELPPLEAYEEFPQIENGVGMVRLFEAELAAAPRLFTAEPAASRRRVALLTGPLFAPILADRIPEALRRTGEGTAFDVRVVAVQNRLFGGGVTVAGLLSAQDLAGALSDREPFDLAVLPPAVLNAEGITLDDRDPRWLAQQTGVAVQVGFGGPVHRPGASPRGGNADG